MALPRPEPGLVIPYAFLWRREREEGHLEGRKVRLVVIVLSVSQSPDGPQRVTVAAVTHSPPADPAEAIEIPPRVKAALGLDLDRSWVVLTEVNQFTWPGFDLRPVPGRPDAFAYGFLPPRLFGLIVAGILTLAAERHLARTNRD